MRIEKIDIPNCFIIEEGNKKLTLFHYDIPIAHIVNSVCFVSDSCLVDSVDKIAFDQFHPRYTERRAMFGHNGVVVKAGKLYEKLTVILN